MVMQRWQDIGNLIIGVWLFVSPFVLNYGADAPTAAWNAYIFGVAIVLFAGFAVYMPQAWEEGINMVLGVWMVVSPWVMGFATQRSAAWNAFAAGVLVTIFATWAMVRDKDFEKWWHDHHVTH